MKHEYYQYNAEEILSKGPKFPLIIMKDNAEVFKSMADEMADTIVEHNAKGEKTVFICPVGPVGQYPYFVDRVNSEKISLKNVWFINMDEYLDDNKEWDPKNPGHIPEVIGQLGGVDICFGGIGINGHVAFNEADGSLSNEEFLAQQTRVLKITPETRTANAIGDFNGALEDMPHYCITIGINEISHARKIRLGCFRNWHRAVVRRAVYGEQTSEFPVSLLQNHSDINLKITEFVASLTD